MGDNGVVGQVGDNGVVGRVADNGVVATRLGMETRTGVDNGTINKSIHGGREEEEQGEEDKTRGIKTPGTSTGGSSNKIAKTSIISITTIIPNKVAFMDNKANIIMVGTITIRIRIMAKIIKMLGEASKITIGRMGIIKIKMVKILGIRETDLRRILGIRQLLNMDTILKTLGIKMVSRIRTIIGILQIRIRTISQPTPTHRPLLKTGTISSRSLEERVDGGHNNQNSSLCVCILKIVYEKITCKVIAFVIYFCCKYKRENSFVNGE